MPATARFLLDWFWEINIGRPVCQAGYLGIPATEIAAWAHLRGITLKPWQLDALRRLDTTFLKVMAEEQQ